MLVCRHENAVKYLMLIQEAKLEKLLRFYRDIKIQALKDQQSKVARHRQLHGGKPSIIKSDKEGIKNKVEEESKEGRDMDPRTEEYEQEAHQLMVSMRVDRGQVADTEKLIFELS